MVTDQPPLHQHSQQSGGLVPSNGMGGLQYGVHFSPCVADVMGSAGDVALLHRCGVTASGGQHGGGNYSPCDHALEIQQRQQHLQPPLADPYRFADVGGLRGPGGACDAGGMGAGFAGACASGCFGGQFTDPGSGPCVGLNSQPCGAGCGGMYSDFSVGRDPVIQPRRQDVTQASEQFLRNRGAGGRGEPLGSRGGGQRGFFDASGLGCFGCSGGCHKQSCGGCGGCSVCSDAGGACDAGCFDGCGGCCGGCHSCGGLGDSMQPVAEGGAGCEGAGVGSACSRQSVQATGSTSVPSQTGGGRGGGKGRTGKQSSSMGSDHSNLFVGHLPEGITQSYVREVFAGFGGVISCRIFSRNGRTCALVKMGSMEEAEAAVRALSGIGGSDDCGVKWLVKFADADIGQGNRQGGPLRRPCEASSAPSDNLYIKGLSPNITETQLHRTFSNAGKAVEMKILRYEDSPECSALIRMASVEAATAAIDILNGTLPEGSAPVLQIRFSGKDPRTPSDNLYVKGLPLDVTQEQMFALFSSCGGVRRCRILEASRHQAVNAAALVQMASVEEASRVIEMMDGHPMVEPATRMTVRYAETKVDAAKAEQEPMDNLYVKGLPLGTAESTVRAVFSQYGNVLRCKVLEPRNGEGHDCAALVQMSHVEEARVAVEALHGRVLTSPLPRMKVKFAGRDQQPGSNLYVAGLPQTLLEQQLRSTFAQCGQVVRLRLLIQPGRTERHALVQMGSVAEAQLAIDRLNNAQPEAAGPTLVVRYAANRFRKTDDWQPRNDQMQLQQQQQGQQQQQCQQQPQQLYGQQGCGAGSGSGSCAGHGGPCGCAVQDYAFYSGGSVPSNVVEGGCDGGGMVPPGSTRCDFGGLQGQGHPLVFTAEDAVARGCCLATSAPELSQAPFAAHCGDFAGIATAPGGRRDFSCNGLLNRLPPDVCPYSGHTGVERVVVTSSSQFADLSNQWPMQDFATGAAMQVGTPEFTGSPDPLVQSGPLLAIDTAMDAFEDGFLVDGGSPPED